MKIKLLILLFISTSYSSFLFSQIITDRPDKTESSTTLSLGHIQIETGISFE